MSGGRYLVVGVGARRDVPAADLDAAIDRALAAAGLDASRVGLLATLDRRAAEAGVRAVADRRGWILAGHPAADLRDVPVPNPSARVREAVGVAGVAEAAALRSAGPGGVLVLPKHSTASVSVAIARTARSSPG